MLVIKGMAGRAESVAFSPDGSLLAAGERGRFHVWDALAGGRVGGADVALSPLRNGRVGVLFTANGRHLVVADSYGGVGVWTPDGGRVRTLHPSIRRYGARAVALAPDGRVLTADVGEEVTAFDPATWVPEALWGPPDGLGGDTLAVEPNGTRVAVGSGAVLAYPTGAPAGRWLPDRRTGGGLAWAPGRPVIATRTGGPTVVVTEPEFGATLAELRPSAKHTNAVCFTVDGRRLLTAGTEGVVRVYDADDWRAPPKEYAWNQGAVYSLAVSPDGTRAAAGVGDSRRGKVVVWDLE